MSDDDDFDAELKMAKASFERAVNRVLNATPLTDEQKATALQQCLTSGCFELAADMLDFAGWAGVPTTENMMFALAGQFDIFVNPGEGAPPPRRQRH